MTGCAIAASGRTALKGELSSRGIDSTNGVAAILGGGMDLKIWKPLSLRLFEADYQLARMNFSNNVPPNDSGLRRQTYNGVRLATGLVFNFGGAPEVPVAAAPAEQGNARGWNIVNARL